MVKECLKVSLERICDEMAKEFQPELRSIMLLQIFMVRIVLDLMRRGEHVSFKGLRLLYLDGVYSPAWEEEVSSLVNFCGQPVGTIVALDNPSEHLNYDK
nr:probable alkaline/neutral invertase B [Tanacetum cinerariifolium]